MAALQQEIGAFEDCGAEGAQVDDFLRYVLPFPVALGDADKSDILP
jgi:hypothetical protein